MKRKVDLFFNYDIDEYKAGYAYKLDLTKAEENRLLRRGCIYPSKDARYYKEEKVAKEEKPAKEELKDVDHKDSKQAKVQTRRAKSSKSQE